MSDIAWPTRRGTRAQFEATYGAALADRFAIAFMETDPLAQSLFESDLPRRDLMMQLRTSLARGEAEPGDAPEVTALIDDMRAVYATADHARLERGRQVYLSIPALTHTVALGPGSLVHTYASPAISKVLVGTGRLVDGALRRLADTRNWSFNLYLPDALAPGAGGFEHTGLVRAMHEYSRREELRRDPDTSTFGMPINAIDMLRTWLDFTYTPYLGLAKLGYEVGGDRLRDVYYFWRVIGRMLGIPADLLVGLDDHESAAPMAAAIDSVAGVPDDDSRRLVDALVSTVAHELAAVLGLPEQVMLELTQAQVRIIHGDELADRFEIPRVSVQVASMLAVPLIQQRYAFLQMLPDQLAQEVAANEAMIGHLLAMTTDGASSRETVPAAA